MRARGGPRQLGPHHRRPGEIERAMRLGGGEPQALRLGERTGQALQVEDRTHSGPGGRTTGTGWPSRASIPVRRTSWRRATSVNPAVPAAFKEGGEHRRESREGEGA